MARIGITGGSAGGIDPDELTATAGDVLKGKIAGVKGNDEPVAGSMPNNGAQSAALNCGQSKVIPAGYTTGGTVTANSLASQTPGTAAAADILAGDTAWVNGNKVVGAMPEKAGTAWQTPRAVAYTGSELTMHTNNGHYADTNYLYSNNAQLASLLGITADKMISGRSIAGVWGNQQKLGYINLYDVGQSTGYQGFTTNENGHVSLVAFEMSNIGFTPLLFVCHCRSYWSQMTYVQNNLTSVSIVNGDRYSICTFDGYNAGNKSNIYFNRDFIRIPLSQADKRWDVTIAGVY